MTPGLDAKVLFKKLARRWAENNPDWIVLIQQLEEHFRVKPWLRHPASRAWGYDWSTIIF